MAKKKSKPAPSSRSKAKAPSKSPAKSVKSPAAKRPPAPSRQTAPIRRTPSAVKVVNQLVDQRKQAVNKVKQLERKFERENRKTYADKLRKEIRSAEKKLDSIRTQIPKERVRVKQEVKIRQEKGAIYSQRYRLNVKMRTLYEKGAQKTSPKEYEKLANRYNYLGSRLRDMNRQLGYEVPGAPSGESGGEGGGGIGGGVPKPEAGAGFTREPSPLASWQTQGHLKDILAGGNWTKVTVNGVTYDKSDPVGEIKLRMAMANFAKDVYKQGSDVSVDVSFNPESGEFIYEATN